MPQHLSDEIFERYRNRTISPEDLLAADDHLAVCELCRQRMSENRGVDGAIATLRAELAVEDFTYAHLSYEEIAAYLDETLNDVDREVVSSHLEICSQCQTELDDLREIETSITDGVPTRRDKLPAFVGGRVFQVALQIAATLVLAILAVWVATDSLKNQLADRQSQIAALQEENTRIRKELETAESAARTLEARLAELEQTRPQPTSPIVVALDDGRALVTLDKQGNLGGVERLPATYKQVIKGALTRQSVEPPPTLTDLIGGAGALRGGGDRGVPFSLVSPVATVVATEHPTLRWNPLNGAASYTASLYDSSLKLEVRSPSLPATEWTVPEPLTRGAVYTWQVTAQVDGSDVLSPTPPAPPAKFKVMDERKADELEEIRRAYGDSHLLMGLVYAQAGALDASERALQALLEANPESSVAERLLKSVQALRED